MGFGSSREISRSRQSMILKELPTIPSDASSPEKKALVSGDGDTANRDPETLSKRSILCCRVSFLNIILIALGFSLNSGAYSAASILLTTVLSNTNDTYFQASPTFGYNLWALSAATEIVACFVCPVFVAILGPKIALVSGSVAVVLYIAALIRPMKATLYVMSAVAGFGANLMWQVQSHFIAKNSTTKRVSRNTGIVLGVFQLSCVTANLWSFLMFNGESHIDGATRIKIYSILAITSAAGGVVLALLQHPWTQKVSRPTADYNEVPQDENRSVTEHRTPLDAFVAVLQAMFNRGLLRLLPIFMYNGLVSSLWGVYASSLGFTERYGSARYALVGLSGSFAGVGSIVASALIAVLGKYMHSKGKDTLLVFGMVVHMGTYYLVFLNSPQKSNLGSTMEASYVGPNAYLAMTNAFFLGLGEGIFTGQLIGFLGSVYKEDCVTVFPAYYFWNNVAAVASLFYASVLALPYQLLILVIFAILGTAGFCSAEWQHLRTRLEAAKKPAKLPDPYG